MRCFELGQTLKPGLLLQSDPYPHITTPEGSSMRLLLGKEVSEVADRARKFTDKPFLLEFAEMELGGDMLVLKKDYRTRRQRRKYPKLSALVRVNIPGGAGGVARLLASSFNEVILGEKRKEEVGRQYHPFPSAGVHPFCSKEHLKKVREGVEVLDVLMMLQPGAGFRVHRTGDLKDQYGESEAAQIVVRWNGYALSSKGYDDRIPVLNPLPEALPAAAE